uniref:nuclear factor 7, ovary-like isoform X9 n=1 Tax=Centroberyx gerrardi TaxID=166262 RepID=UPI003AAF7337
MASAISLLSEEQFLCSICLDVFTEPVSTPCGHKFCKSCITRHWESKQLSQCPLCNEKFHRRPELRVNTGFRDLNKKDTEEEIAKSVEVFTALVASIQRNQAELIEVIEEKQRAAEKQAEGFIKELEQEISELQRRSTELERLSHTEDHLHLLQSFPSCSSSPHTNNWSGISVRTHLCVETVRRAVAQMEETLAKEMTTLMRRIQQLYAVDVTLDPDTAHPKLILSEDGKQVRCGNRRQNLPDNPERFNQYINILGKEGFSSGKIYFEVQVKGTDWDLGVVRESSNRKGEISYSPEEGYWIIWLRDGNDYKALDDPSVSLSLREKPEKVGVFVDHEEGLVSFYDVEAETLIYPFTGCTFKEKIYPFFCPSYNEAAPLIITPVKYTE